MGASRGTAIVARVDDPLDDHLQLDHDGVVQLRAAADLLDAGDAAGAVAAAARARGRGVPAELGPYLATVDGIASALDGDREYAARVLADAWANHPDVAVLPAALGAVRLLTGDATDAALVQLAALVSDDPDRSLELHRRRLTQLYAAVRREVGGPGSR
jgi:hypothetical protein